MKLWTNSRRSAFQRCKREHYLSYIEGWKKRIEPEDSPLYYGTEWHSAMEVFWAGGDLDAVLGAVSSKFEDPEAQIRIELCLRGYYAKYDEWRSKFRVVHIEITFTTPMINPATGAKSRTWKNGGKYDVVLQALEDITDPVRIDKGKYYNLEHKSTGDDITEETADYWLKLLMDVQVSHYHVAGALEFEIEGTIYDVAMKLNGNLRRKQKSKGVRKRKDETEEEFAARKEADRETLDEYRQRLEEEKMSPDMFQWRMAPRTEVDLREYQFDTWHTALEAHNTEVLGFAPRNPDACMRFGKPCKFFMHCATGSDLRYDRKFQQSEWVHPELPELQGKI